MKIRTQLFIGASILVLALVALQTWLHLRQLEALRQELDQVAMIVGAELLEKAPHAAMFWTQNEESSGLPKIMKKQIQHEVVIQTAPPDQPSQKTTREKQMHTLNRFEFKVESDTVKDHRVLIVTGQPGEIQRVELPDPKTSPLLQSNFKQGLLGAGLVLAVGLLGAATMAQRIGRPIRKLAESANALANGQLGVQVTGKQHGEVGELMHAFNSMSARLAELEEQREKWLAREHLAELGELSRALGHTLRNPLHTLGLLVEELATQPEPPGAEQVSLAKAQIRRIDRWLRSFLSVGAGKASEAMELDLRDLLQDAQFEAVQQGGVIALLNPDQPILAQTVPQALRAALANLIENAIQASPSGSSVELSLRKEGQTAIFTVSDHGAGLPPEVKARLFSPHTTTKANGSGMGLFLAKQLVQGALEGTLILEDRPGGGTLASIVLPLKQA